ncbi:MAG: serine/threonine-protein kinase, partial [Polyangiales bacterium]
RALARLTHPNVVAVYGVGVWSGGVFLAIELVRGTTVREWMAAPRGWRDVVRVFAAAARGLAAAHAAGLVHRDVKPENLVVGDDGRVRVIDFGLAIDRDERGAAIAGTPAYMSAEQRAGAEIDARADQYAHAVSLFEALEGKRPAAGARAYQATPRAVRRVIDRATAPLPDERYPDLATVADRLESALGARRRQVVGAGLAMLVGAGAVVAWVGVRSPSVETCTAGPERLAGIWDAARKEQLATSFRATGVDYADATFATVAAKLDAQATQWLAMYTGACEATHVRHEQPADVLDLRMECLHARRGELRAVVDQLSTVDRPRIQRAVATANALTGVAECGDGATLAAAVRPPTDPVVRAQANAIGAELASVKALGDSGNYAAARKALDSIVPAARALGYSPTLANALFELGRAQVFLRDKASEATLREALRTAELARMDPLKADAAIALVTQLTVKYEGKMAADAITALGDDARAVIQRIGGDQRRLARLERSLGSILRLADHQALALQHFETALGLIRGLDGEDSVEYAETSLSAANVLTDFGRREESATALKHAIAVFETKLGKDHPNVGVAVGNLGTVFTELGKPAEATPLLERAVVIARKTYGNDSPNLVDDLVNLGYAKVYAGKSDEALAHFEEARGILERLHQPEDVYFAMVVEATGRAQQGLSRAADSEASFRRALAIRLEISGPDDSDVAQSHRDLGELLSALQQKLPEVLVHYTEALRIDEAVFGAASVKLSPDLKGVAAALLDLKRPAEALPHLERALALETAADVEPLMRAGTRYFLADALWASGKDRAHARVLATEALELIKQATRDEVSDDRKLVETWLATHR